MELTPPKNRHGVDKGLEEASLIELTPPNNLAVPKSAVHIARIVRERTIDRWHW
jgi:hypothetical protein